MCATIFLMKERYFTSESIHRLSSQWLNAYARPERLKSQPFDINRAALLVLDMQEYFLNPDSHAYIPSAKAILPGINQAISYFRTNHRPIIATKHVNSINDAGMMAAWWSEIMTENHPLIGLHPDLDLKEAIDRKQFRFMGGAAAYAYLAMQSAIEDAGLTPDEVSNIRTGIILTSGAIFTNTCAIQVPCPSVENTGHSSMTQPGKITRSINT